MIVVFLGLMVFGTGCSLFWESGKKIVGVSTLDLEKGRLNAISETFQCEFDQCFEAVKSLDRKNELLTPWTDKFFNIFQNKKQQKFLVVMGIAGNVDTTEVGIFFVPIENLGSTRIEVSSRSQTAKEKVSEAVFAELNERFNTKKEKTK